MPVANWNTKILDLKRWTVVPSVLPVSPSGGFFTASSPLHDQNVLCVISATQQFLYDPFEDGFTQVPSGSLAGTFGAGACGAASAIGPSGTATGGTGTTIATGLTLARSLAGFRIELTGGPGAGDVRTIAANGVGANSVITVTSAFSATPTASTTFRLITPRWFVLSAGTLATGSFRVYDFALNSWTSLSIAGLPTTWGGDGALVATPSYTNAGQEINFASGTATAGTSTTLTNSARAWATNQWANFQIKITSGTGAGQIRTIASNTGTVITVSAAWTTTPDATSAYHIEGNDDFLYLLGNSAVALYRYSIGSNSWTTLTPAAARAGVPAAGGSGHWVYNVTEDAGWSAENAIINGRRIYSFRGGSGSLLDYYDIAANTWVSAVPYAPATETFSTGSRYVYSGNWLYMQKDTTGRWFRYSFARSEQTGWAQTIYPQGGANVGNSAFEVVEPTSGVRFLHFIPSTSTIHLRAMVI